MHRCRVNDHRELTSLFSEPGSAAIIMTRLGTLLIEVKAQRFKHLWLTSGRAQADTRVSIRDMRSCTRRRHQSI
jgi:hypothetical protein